MLFLGQAVGVILLVIIVLLLLALVVGTGRERFDEPPITPDEVTVVFSNDFPFQKKWLCVYSQFKNEKHVLLEWVHHYVAEGADHVILVDNESDDGYDRKALESIPNLTLFFTRLRHRQTHVAQYVFEHFVDDHFTWAVNLDMDEFLYARKYPCISDYLRKLDPQQKAVVVPWKSFGSNDHVAQPPNVIDHFLFRDEDFPRAENANLVKTLFQPQHYTLRAHVVAARLDAALTKYPHVGMEGVRADAVAKYGMWHTFDRNTLDLDYAHLHLNHYQIQSQDFWMRVKMSRGDADHDGWDRIRNLDYFAQRDKNLVFDSELSRKKKIKKPNLLVLLNPSNLQDSVQWHLEYTDRVGKIHFVAATPAYDSLVSHYLSNDSALVVCGDGKNKKQFEFVLSRTLLTGRSVFPVAMEGHPPPSLDIFAIRASDRESPQKDECTVYYDGKVLPFS